MWILVVNELSEVMQDESEVIYMRAYANREEAYMKKDHIDNYAKQYERFWNTGVYFLEEEGDPFINEERYIEED
jgi:hypothetical protein